jgi:hypothetical protein
MNKLNSGSIETLVQGHALLTQVKAVKNDFYQIEIAQIIRGESQMKNVLGVLNADNPDFQSKARRAWTNASAKMMQDMFGVDVSKLKLGATMPLNILDPQDSDGDRFVIRVTETTEPRTYINDSGETVVQKPKQIVRKDGKTIVFRTTEGKDIYSNTTIDFESNLKIKPSFKYAEQVQVELDTVAASVAKKAVLGEEAIAEKVIS